MNEEKIITSAAVDRLKKCYISDPETNLRVPIELTVTDVRPYFEDQELLGRLTASEFAPHVFDKEQEFPMTLPATSPCDDLPKTSAAAKGNDFPETSVPSSAKRSSGDSPTAPISLELPSEPIISETVIPKSQPIEVPETKRSRGPPPGRKNKPKTCPNCTPNVTCVDHCTQCKTGSACEQHTARQRCAKCTRTRTCTAHS